MAISMRQTRLSNIKFVLFLLNLQTHPYPKYSDIWQKAKFKQRCGSYQFPPKNHKSNPQHIWNVFHRLIQWVQAPIRPVLIAISWGLRVLKWSGRWPLGAMSWTARSGGISQLYTQFIYIYVYIYDHMYIILVHVLHVPHQPVKSLNFIHMYIYNMVVSLKWGIPKSPWVSMWPHWMVRRKSSPNGESTFQLFPGWWITVTWRHTHRDIYIYIYYIHIHMISTILYIYIYYRYIHWYIMLFMHYLSKFQ